jgi:hypothetical protein
MRAILCSCPFERKRPESGLSPYCGTGIDNQTSISVLDHRASIQHLILGRVMNGWSWSYRVSSDRCSREACA